MRLSTIHWLAWVSHQWGTLTSSDDVRQLWRGERMPLGFYAHSLGISTCAVRAELMCLRNRYHRYRTVTHPAYNADGRYTAPVVLFGFIIGLQCCACFFFIPSIVLYDYQYSAAMTMSAAIEAGVSTMYVQTSVYRDTGCWFSRFPAS